MADISPVRAPAPFITPPEEDASALTATLDTAAQLGLTGGGLVAGALTAGAVCTKLPNPVWMPPCISGVTGSAAWIGSLAASVVSPRETTLGGAVDRANALATEVGVIGLSGTAGAVLAQGRTALAQTAARWAAAGAGYNTAQAVTAKSDDEFWKDLRNPWTFVAAGSFSEILHQLEMLGPVAEEAVMSAWSAARGRLTAAVESGAGRSQSRIVTEVIPRAGERETPETVIVDPVVYEPSPPAKADPASAAPPPASAGPVGERTSVATLPFGGSKSEPWQDGHVPSIGRVSAAAPAPQKESSFLPAPRRGAPASVNNVQGFAARRAYDPAAATPAEHEACHVMAGRLRHPQVPGRDAALGTPGLFWKTGPSGEPVFDAMQALAKDDVLRAAVSDALAADVRMSVGLAPPFVRAQLDTPTLEMLSMRACEVDARRRGFAPHDAVPGLSLDRGLKLLVRDDAVRAEVGRLTGLPMEVRVQVGPAWRDIPAVDTGLTYFGERVFVPIHQTPAQAKAVAGYLDNIRYLMDNPTGTHLGVPLRPRGDGTLLINLKPPLP